MEISQIKSRIIQYLPSDDPEWESNWRLAQEIGGQTQDGIQHAANRDDSILDGEGAKIGVFGEIYTNKCLGWRHLNALEPGVIHGHYDLQHPVYLNVTGECKAKRRTVRPQSHYLNTIAACNTRQATKYYMFSTVLMNTRDKLPRAVWLTGYIPPAIFRAKPENGGAFLGKKGEKDPTSFAPFPFVKDCFNMPIFSNYPFPTGNVRPHQVITVSVNEPINPKGMEILSRFTQRNVVE
jgi:hypothetical protein